ncbi:MAG: response regulator, partial [Desulfovibrionaceae bacterium]
MDGAKPHLLVVDRNRNVREFLRREFARLGFEVQTARDEGEALLSAGRDRPDAIVLDPDAPRSGRAPLFERLHRGHPDVPIVVHLLS